MKTFITSLLIFVLSQLVFSQINPVQNLQWYQTYDYPYNVFELIWEEPQNPHDGILGYNIYRENELYRFQTETWLGFSPDFESNVDEDFLLYNDSEGFTIYVSAVYEGEIESEYESAYCEGYMLNSVEQFINDSQIYPNPVVNELYFSEKLKNIKIFDSDGKVIFIREEVVSSLNFQSYAAGIYWLKAETVSGKLFEQKFIKK